MTTRRNALKFGMLGGLTVAGFPTRLATSWAQVASPEAVAPALSQLLHQNIPDLKTAAKGEIEVVLSAHHDTEYAAVVIHNATEEEVGIADVTGIARDPGGALHAVSEHSIMAPYVLQPGEYGIGLVPFDKPLEPSSGIAFSISTDTPGQSVIGIVDLPVTEVVIEGDSVIGVVENTTDEEASALVAIVGIFFDPEGEICGWFRTYLTTSVPPGGIGTFISSGLEGETSASYAIAASGWAG